MLAKRAPRPRGELVADFAPIRGGRRVFFRRDRRKVLGPDRLTAGDDGRVLDGVTELAYVPGPGPRPQRVQDVAA